ncbi:hypothetical protein GP486_003526 [Trichoglossum hirsutum]|uniref:PKS/mFAS DH domain-containing protein n=1 Tax=Trichoglossum hirsutum TaxID=265104 RepID=A0A9P8RR14_9PEZI|nr:hypothetical protein GP486_003526 [Trichoglossum hirsutum]
MQAVGPSYQSLLGNHLIRGTAVIPFFSSVTGEKIRQDFQLGGSYWRQNLESPVLFNAAVKSILEEPSRSGINKLFIEIGPHSALAGPLRQIFKSVKTTTSPQYLATMTRDANCSESLLKTAGQLYLQGVPLHFAAVNPHGKVLTDLPTYPWHHEDQYWTESRLTREWRIRKFPRHEILGSRVIEGNDLEPTWRNILRLDDAPWIRDHVILKDIIFPGMGYVAMAGEAVRQLTGSSDYTVRHTVIKTALVLHESEGTEMMTSLRPARLTDSLDSVWYDFTIMSYNGTSWIKRCVGQVRAGPAHAIVDSGRDSLGALPRTVSSARWYKSLKRVGLSYGPAFAGMTNISAAVMDEAAIATIATRPELNEPLCGLHPAAMDMCLQVYSVAACKGLPRRVEQLCVPAYVGELYVRQASSPVRVKVLTSSTERGTITGDAVGVADGQVVFRIRGLKLPPLEGPEKDPDPHAGQELEWKPDLDFLGPQLDRLILPGGDGSHAYSVCEKLTVLCMLEAEHQSLSVGSNEFLEKYRCWIDNQAARAKRGEYDLVPDAQKFAALRSSNRRSLIEATLNEALLTFAAPLGRAIVRVFEHSNSILSGETDPLDLLLKDNVLANVYDVSNSWNYKAFLQLTSHHKPNLHILEIGAGTGGTTRSILEDLTLPDGTRMYADYTYTDISAGFFVAAKERFKNAQNMKYAVLDITKDPVEQGFRAGTYDLVVASNGTFSGWWFGSEDNRIDEPYITPQRWDHELRTAGFSGVDVVVHDHEGDFKMNAVIVAAPAAAERPEGRRVTLLHSGGETCSPVVTQMEASLKSQGYTIDLCTLHQTPPPDQDVLSLLDLESTPFFASITPLTFHAFRQFITHLPSPSTGILWVTRSSQLKCQNPEYGLIHGMARTARCELSLDFGTLEVDHIDNSGLWGDMVVKVLEKFQRRDKDGEMGPDWEFAISEGMVHVPRFKPISVLHELAKSSLGRPVKKLVIGKRGLLQTLQWVERPLTSALNEGDVEVEMRAVGLNFKDVIISMGIIEGRVIEGDGLGCEGAGVVRRVGSGIKHLKPGDRVIYFGMGSFATIVKWDSSLGLVMKIPEYMSFADAATLPVVYGTVVYSLLDVARAEKGQDDWRRRKPTPTTFLSTSTLLNKFQIYATVGSEEKVQYLMTTYGIPRSHIFNSRDTSFLPAVMAATGNRGVDIVLNSLTGELFHASWQCVAEFGKMVEIGKRDFIGRGKLDVDLFEMNRSFFGVDFARIYHHNPQLSAR